MYTGTDMNRRLVLERRDALVASKITQYLKATDRMAKPIVFCEDIDHAKRMRQALNNANADLCATQPTYVVQITGDNPQGKRELGNFIDPERPYPVIATTSKPMSTGVDAQTCKLIVLDQNIRSMTLFKQIIGRGTRLRTDLGLAALALLVDKPLAAVGEDEQPFALPRGWEWMRFDGVAEVQGLRVANVQRGAFKLAEIERYELTDDELARWRLLANDFADC